MKTTLTRALAVALLIVAMAAISVTATGTLAGTLISNSATVNYKDINNNSKTPVTSNTVTTTVNSVCGVDVTPNAGYTGTGEDKIREYAFVITNTGNDFDSYDLALSGIPSGWTATIYHDADGDGVLDPGETTVTSSTGTLDPTAPTIIGHTRVDHYNVIVQVFAPLAPTVVNQTANITLTATCAHDPAHPSPKTDSASLTMTVQQAVITVTKVAGLSNPIPLQQFDYTITVSNSGLVQAYDIVVTDILSANLAFVGPLYYDADGSGTVFSPVVVNGAHSAGTITVPIGSLGAGITATITFTAEVTAEVAAGVSILNTASVAYEDANDYSFVATGGVSINVSASAGVDIAESYDDAYTDPGDILVVPFTIENTGNATDVIEITMSQTGDLPLTWTIYFDTNGNGVYDSGDTEVTNTNGLNGIDTGSMPKDAKYNFIAVATVPADASNASANELTITATTTVVPTDNDFITIKNTVKAPVLTITKAVDKATANPGETLTFTITVTNIGLCDATSVVITDDINAILDFVDYVLASIKVDGVAQTDADDYPGTDYADYTSGVITVNIPTIDGTLRPIPNVDYVITFQVTIK